MPFHYTSAEIAGVVNGNLITRQPAGYFITQLLTDSRRLGLAAQTIFFAIKTPRNNGHKYVKSLYDKGVRCFVITEYTVDFEDLDADFIIVPNPLQALQALAAHHRCQYALPVVAITGSNGKTIVKEWLYQLLREDYHIVRSPKSYNSKIGVPLSVWQIITTDNLALIEAGISQPGEMAQLESIIAPTVGILTNIGTAHAENFETRQQLISEKLLLFQHVEKIFYPADDVELHQQMQTQYANKQLLSWGYNIVCTLSITAIENKGTTSHISGKYLGKLVHIDIPFTDGASIANCITCWLFLLDMGLADSMIAERMLQLSPVAMRLELNKGINNCSVINDSYNSDIKSLQIALDLLEQQHQHPIKTLILSDILQSGKSETDLYQEVSDLLKQKHIDKLIGIGPAISSQQQAFTVEKTFYPSTEAFLAQFDPENTYNEAILLKGARSFGFEQIMKRLQQKAHRTVMEVNLNAIVHNLNYYRSLLKPNVKIMCMVKAFSYGSGSFEIANVLQFHQVDYLAVAYADEGVDLRKAGIHTPIMVMNPEAQSFEMMLAYNLEPELYSLTILREWLSCINKNISADKKHSVHLKLDTGMRRLGFEEKDIPELIDALKQYPSLQVNSIFSHLAASEADEHSTFTNQQCEEFIRMRDAISVSLQTPSLSHILNSAGIKRFTHYQFNMVRLGLGLYGLSTDTEEQQLLQNASTLKTTISQIKQVPAGETIGYSRSGKANKPITIATIAIGYADGISRLLGNNNGKVSINGKYAPIIGNICMDMCMVDITGISAHEGDEVIVFQTADDIHNLSIAAGSIPYEIITGVSQRVKRVYYQE